MKGRESVKLNNLKQHFSEFSPIYLTQAIFTGCFYGIRAIFVLYTINQFSLGDAETIQLFATFMALCYGTSLIGGYIADKGLGVKRTIISGGIFSSLGLVCILSPLQDLFFLGLAMISLGSGFIKPNLLIAAGLFFENPKDPRKDKVYSLLYIAMNVGNLIFPITCGFIGKGYGWHYGIGLIAAILAGSTYFVYKTMRFHPSHKEAPFYSQGTLLGIILLLVVLLYYLFKYQESFHSLMGIIIFGSFLCLGKIYYQSTAQERKDVLTVMAYVFLFALFCTLYEQAGTSMMLFYEKAVDRQVMGITIPSSAFLSLDPLFVLLYGPLLLFLSTRYFEKTKPMSGFTKIGCGFLFVAANFGILALSAFGDMHPIPLLWIVGAFFVQTIGELWIAPVSFSKISQHAPPRFKSILMSFWQIAIAYGHYLAGFIAQFSLQKPERLSLAHPSKYTLFFADLSFFALCIGLYIILHQRVKSSIMRR